MVVIVVFLVGVSILSDGLVFHCVFIFSIEDLGVARAVADYASSWFL